MPDCALLVDLPLEEREEGPVRRSLRTGKDVMNKSVIYEAALRYAEGGVPVVPIVPGNNFPLTEHGVHDASTDPRTIAAWWRQWPRADLALACGERSGFDVLDVDQQYGGIDSLAQLAHTQGAIPDTACQLTPSGGFHLLFHHEPGLKNRSGGQGGAPLGLDCRTSGAMIRTAPTGGYRWTLMLPPADSPAWLAAFYRDLHKEPSGANGSEWRRVVSPEHADQAERYAVRAIKGIARDIAAVKPGCQETTLNGASFRAGRMCAAAPSLVPDAVIHQLIAAGLSMENAAGRRPWTQFDIERIVRRGVKDGWCRGPAILPDFYK